MIVAIFMGLSTITSSAYAQQKPGTGSGLSISPTRTDLVVNAGATADLHISVKNVTGGSVIAKPFINDFAPDGKTGAPQLISDSSIESAYSIKKFIKDVNQFEFKAGETKNLTIKVTVPKNAAPGAYYGVIRYQAVPDSKAPNNSGGGQVSLTASVGSLVLIEVPGEIRQQASIETVSAYLNYKSGSIFIRKPNKIGIEINNLGNGFARPSGEVKVRDMSGNQVFSYKINDTNPQGVVLPNSTRIFKDAIENINSPGRYKIDVFISYVNGGEVYTKTATFWYIPLWLLAGGLIVILLLVLSVGLLYRNYITKTTKRRR